MRIKSAKGFSLIELLIVIAIIAILATVAAPNYNKYRYNTKLKEVARDIADDIKLYKQKAMNENIYYMFSYYTYAGYYYETIYQSCPNTTTWCWNYYSSRKISDDGSVIFSGSPNFYYSFNGTSGNGGYLIFTPRRTTSAGSLTLQQTTQLSTATITTYFMGRVTITYVLK